MENLHSQAKTDCETLCDRLTDLAHEMRAVSEWACVSDAFRRELQGKATRLIKARENIYSRLGR